MQNVITQNVIMAMQNVDVLSIIMLIDVILNVVQHNNIQHCHTQLNG
jgi:hypothetical protein